MGINNQKQSAGDNSTQVIANEYHNHQGIQVGDVIHIVHGLVKNELEIYQQVAELKAQSRFEEFSRSLESAIENKVADKIDKFSEPSMQYATRAATLGYIKSGDNDQKEMLVNLLIDRLKSDDQSTEQLLIDEAIQILPKLSPKCIAVLTLMTFNNLKVSGHKSILESYLKKLNPIIDSVFDVKNIDLEYLVQTGCISSILAFRRNGNWFQSNVMNYPLLFCYLDNNEATEKFILKYGFEKKKDIFQFPLGINPQQATNLFSCFDITVDGKFTPSLLTPDRYSEIADQLKPFAEEDILSLLENRTPMSDAEITNYYSKINPRWVETINVIENKLSKYNLNLVGKYIGSIHLTKLLETPISLELLIPN